MWDTWGRLRLARRSGQLRPRNGAGLISHESSGEDTADTCSYVAEFARIRAELRTTPELLPNSATIARPLIATNPDHPMLKPRKNRPLGQFGFSEQRSDEFVRQREQLYGEFFGPEFTVSHELLPMVPHIKGRSSSIDVSSL